MSRAPDDALLAQAELALETLRFKERAALYHAAAQWLQAALRQAEHGNRDPLEHWFLQHRDLIDLPLSPNDPSPSPGTSQETIPRYEPVPRYESVPNKSPWAEMEAAILQRKREEQPVPDGESELTESPSLVPETESSEEEIPSLGIDSPSTSSDVTDIEAAAVIASPFHLDHERAPTHRSKRPWWRASHVWISAAVHAFAIGLLSLVVIQQISQPQVLAIVSATVEAEEVLVETPMESPSELEAEPVETLAMETPNFDPDIPDIPDPTMSELDLSGPLLTQENSAREVAKALQAKPVSAPGKNWVAGAEFFGVKATGKTFVYIVDCSPSMRRDNAFDFAKQEITRSLQSMKPSQRFSILFFGKEVERLEFSPGQPEEFPVPATPENVEKTLRWMARCSIQKEGLPPNDALDLAIAMQPDGVFLLFDGDTRVDVPKHLGQANRSTDILTSGEPRVPIHVVHFFLDEFAPAMQRVAAENLGTYRFIPRPERGSKSKR
jgi:hypothetical protein